MALRHSRLFARLENSTSAPRQQFCVVLLVLPWRMLLAILLALILNSTLGKLVLRVNVASVVWRACDISRFLM